ncbi:MAG TPA: GtrA family protein [Candidatus Paceibacterota bacterium]|nr:GtrA family protein [Candidatus Paceibacterota bacterium]
MLCSIARFVKYSTVGVATFVLDLALLYCAVRVLNVPYYAATPCTFLIAVSVNYVLSRKFVFAKTERPTYTGYAYFISGALCGAIATTALTVALVTYLHIFYIAARVLVAALVGIGNYLFNLHINFKVAGKH